MKFKETQSAVRDNKGEFLVKDCQVIGGIATKLFLVADGVVTEERIRVYIHHPEAYQIPIVGEIVVLDFEEVNGRVSIRGIQ